MSDQSAQTPSSASKMVTITLVEPLKRGDTEITEINLRKPGAGEMRGLSLLQLQRSDVGAILTLLPRITVPPITDHEANVLSIEDLSQFAVEISDFFLTPQQRELAAEMLKNLSPT